MLLKTKVEKIYLSKKSKLITIQFLFGTNRAFIPIFSSKNFFSNILKELPLVVL